MNYWNWTGNGILSLIWASLIFQWSEWKCSHIYISQLTNVVWHVSFGTCGLTCP
jgi:hypothetical protein